MLYLQEKQIIIKNYHQNRQLDEDDNNGCTHTSTYNCLKFAIIFFLKKTMWIKRKIDWDCPFSMIGFHLWGLYSIQRLFYDNILWWCFVENPQLSNFFFQNRIAKNMTECPRLLTRVTMYAVLTLTFQQIMTKQWKISPLEFRKMSNSPIFGNFIYFCLFSSLSLFTQHKIKVLVNINCTGRQSLVKTLSSSFFN